MQLTNSSLIAVVYVFNVSELLFRKKFIFL